jgi:hypothetical protein
VIIAIAYDDPEGIRRDSLGLGNVRVSGPNGFQQFPAPQSAVPSAAGHGITASYHITLQTGKWLPAEQGMYSIEVTAF